MSETARSIAAMTRSGERSAAETARSSLERLDSDEARSLGAVRPTEPEAVLAQAEAVDRRVNAGEDLPLAGVPILVKDNICTTLGLTSCGSRLLERYRSPYNAAAIERLIDAGAVILGKTGMDEFGMGSSCVHDALAAVRHPRDPKRVPGGSSGGSAVAVAAGLAPVALGSDTGGSIRQPAAFCGVVGLKPTYGRVPRYGLVAYASSLDTIGPITTNTADASLVLSIMSGVDPRDATSADVPAPEVVEEEPGDLNGTTVGVVTNLLGSDNHPAVNDAVARTAERLRDAGAQIVEIELTAMAQAIDAYYIIAAAEASSNLARFDGVRYGTRAELDASDSIIDMFTKSRTQGFGEEVKRRIMLGAFALSAGYADQYYVRALRARRLVADQFQAAWDKGVNALLLPTAPGPAFERDAFASNPLSEALQDVYTVGASLAGLPAVSVPAGETDENGVMLPIGVQLVAPAFEESGLLRVAFAAHRAECSL